MADLVHSHPHGPARHPDGTDDLTLGVWFLMFSLMVQMGQRTSGIWRCLVVSYGLIAATWVVTHFGIREVRSRLVYRRSGYVQPFFRLRPRIVVMLVGMLVGFFVTFLLAYVVKKGTGALSVPLLLGLLFGLTQLVVAVRQRSPRRMGYAILSVVIGVVLQFLEPGWTQSAVVSGASWYWLLMGIALLLGGAITLYLFVRRTPSQNSELE